MDTHISHCRHTLSLMVRKHALKSVFRLIAPVANLPGAGTEAIGAVVAPTSEDTSAPCPVAARTDAGCTLFGVHTTALPTTVPTPKHRTFTVSPPSDFPDPCGYQRNIIVRLLRKITDDVSLTSTIRELAERSDNKRLLR